MTGHSSDSHNPTTNIGWGVRLLPYLFSRMTASKRRRGQRPQTPPATPPSRQPQWLERYYIYRVQLGFYTNFSVTYEVDREIGKQDLFHGLLHLVKQQPWYTLQFFNDNPQNPHNGDWRVSVVDKITFSDNVIFHEVDEFTDAVLQQLNDIVIGMNKHQPLWRIHVFTDKTRRTWISGVFCHSVFDGGSGAVFMDELLEQLAGESNCSCNLDLVYHYGKDGTFADGEIPPPRECLTNLYDPTTTEWIEFYVAEWCRQYLPASIRHWLHWLWHTLTQWLKGSPSPYAANSPVYYNPNHKWEPKTATKVRNINFSPAQTEDMLTWCRNQGVTLTPFLTVGICQAMQSSLFHSQLGCSMSAYIALQGRRYYPDMEIKGGFVCGQDIGLAPITDAYGAIGYVNQEMWQGIDSRKPFRLTGLVREVDLDQLFETRWKAPKKSVTVSNLGRVKEQHNHYRVLDAFFVSCTGATYNTCANVMSTSRGGLNVTFCYYPEFDNETVNERPALDVFADNLTEFCTKWLHTVD
ncbi:hypothetical protein DIRU0_C23332 [Diutina rugosa]